MSWGKILLIIYVGFCALLGWSVYILVTHVKVDLVSRYYRQEAQNYQQLIEAKQRAAQIHPFRVNKADPFMLLQVPEEQIKTTLRGEAFFYCVYDEKFDKTIQLEPDKSGQQMIPQSWLKGKRYTIKLQWNDGKQVFYTERELNLTH